MTSNEGERAKVAVLTQRPNRARNLLLIVAAFLVVLAGVTGGVVALLALDDATSIDRSTPEVTTEQFLDAMLVEPNPDKLSLFLCSTWPASGAASAAAPPTGAEVSANWGDFTTTTDGPRATVTVNVQFAATVGGSVQRLSQTWTLTLVNEGGWRVCGLSKASSLQP